MGFTPAQIDEMSPWEFAACIAGYNRHNSDKVEPPTEEEFEEALREAAPTIATMH